MTLPAGLVPESCPICGGAMVRLVPDVAQLVEVQTINGRPVCACPETAAAFSGLGPDEEGAIVFEPPERGAPGPARPPGAWSVNRHARRAAAAKGRARR